MIHRDPLCFTVPLWLCGFLVARWHTMMAGKGWKSPLHEMTQTTPTALWNDSADLEELTFALAHGAVGATCNPVIAHTVIKSHLAEWRPRITRLLAHWPTATEDAMTAHCLSCSLLPILSPRGKGCDSKPS